MKEQTELLEYPQFNEILTDFLNEIISLNETLPLVMTLISIKDDQKEKEFNDFIKKHTIKKDKTTIQDSTEPSDEEEDYISLKIEDYIQYEELQKNLNIASVAFKVIPRSLFVSLISQFDAYLGLMIKKIYELFPERLNDCEKNLTFSQLLEFNSIEDAKEYIIEKEVESVLRESHTYHFEWLEKKLATTLRKDLPVWPTFIEITERRNLYVHNDGHVSNQYLAVCKKNKVALPTELKTGDMLHVNPEYFTKAYECIFEISVKLNQVIWRKLIANDLENADNGLNDICYDLIQKEEFLLADILLDFATNILPKHYNELSKNVFIINQALSKYLSGKKDLSDGILNQKDWSASNNSFKLAVSVLKENYQDVYELMKQIGMSEDVPRHAYQTWPLFKKIREKQEFLETYKSIFNEDYKIIERPSKKILMMISDTEDAINKALKQRKSKRTGKKPRP
jgi:hypothetical protein